MPDRHSYIQPDDEVRPGPGRRCLWVAIALLSTTLAYSAATASRAAELRRLGDREASLDRRLSELFEAHSRALESSNDAAPMPSELWRVHRAAQVMRQRIGELQSGWPWDRCPSGGDPSPVQPTSAEAAACDGGS